MKLSMVEDELKTLWTLQQGLTAKNQSSAAPFSQPPRKPDWLILLMNALILLILLIV